ncbi:MAG: hypothetical protein ABR999_05025 [Methanoregula sp.]|uniref:hypothetical protein n=1 Tax=Methanoregula sp. TaxID=2052170 RepID=UPI003D0CD83B
MAGRTHGSFADPLELFAAVLAPVVFRLDPVFGKIDIQWSANTTHAPITSVSYSPIVLFMSVYGSGTVRLFIKGGLHSLEIKLYDIEQTQVTVYSEANVF